MDIEPGSVWERIAGTTVNVFDKRKMPQSPSEGERAYIRWVEVMRRRPGQQGGAVTMVGYRRDNLPLPATHQLDAATFRQDFVLIFSTDGGQPCGSAPGLAATASARRRDSPNQSKRPLSRNSAPASAPRLH